VCCGWLWSASVSAVVIVMSVFEQQADIKFFYKLGKSATETSVSFTVGNAYEAHSSVYDQYTN